MPHFLCRRTRGQPGAPGAVLLAGLPHSGGAAAHGGAGGRLQRGTSRGAAGENISTQVLRRRILGE